MGKKRKGVPSSASQPERTGGDPSKSASPSGSGAAANRPPRTWMETHGRDLRFLGIFTALMVVYYILTTTSAMKDRFFPWYLQVNAEASVAVLRTFGYPDVSREGKSVISPRGSITVERGCDAIEPSALFVSAVLASPVPFVSRLLAAAIGTAVLLTINLVRIISLFLCAVHWRSAFDVMHLDVWQALFIFLAILSWAAWAAWAVRRRKKRLGDAGT